MMPVANPFDAVKAAQRAWATQSGRAIDKDGYCGCVDDNIFQGLSVGARKDFESGDGTELGTRGARGKIQALHSSSALACNWFDYWRGRDMTPLTRAFGALDAFCGVALEQKFSTRVGGIGPNIDVVVKSADGTLFAIESKFGEPYTRSKTKTYLKPRYYRDGLSLWTEAGLPACQSVAGDLQAGRHGYRVLDVAQLPKHMLALAVSGYRWALCCIWFEIPGTVAEQHRKELKDFTSQLGPEAAHFSALTYQDLFGRMTHSVGDEHAEYMAYLRDRYLSRAVVS
jgi:Restriction Endonuclease associating with ARP